MHAYIVRLANAIALLGGLVLTALIFVTCTSILGRSANTFAHSGWLTTHFPDVSSHLINSGIGPITGDYELVEAGMAFAIFAFLPLCQLRGGHAAVDIFAGFLPTKVNQALIVFWEVLLAAVIVLISWRLAAGMMAKVSNGETTFLLQFPVWWSYAASFAVSVVAALVAVYCAWSRVNALFGGQPDRIGSEGGAH